VLFEAGPRFLACRLDPIPTNGQFPSVFEAAYPAPFCMSPELSERIYQRVLGSVLWGTDRSEIVEMLEVNGITGDDAEAMLHRAHGERVATLRAEAVRLASKGAVFLAAGLALFCGFWFGLGFINRLVYVASGLLVAFGFWWLINGILDLFFASSKKGPISPV
jgi:hypothetical protein